MKVEGCSPGATHERFTRQQQAQRDVRGASALGEWLKNQEP